jgi:hypothetical protein
MSKTEIRETVKRKFDWGLGYLFWDDRPGR